MKKNLKRLMICTAIITLTACSSNVLSEIKDSVASVVKKEDKNFFIGDININELDENGINELLEKQINDYISNSKINLSFDSDNVVLKVKDLNPTYKIENINLEEIKTKIKSGEELDNIFIDENGVITADTLNPLSEESKNIIKDITEEISQKLKNKPIDDDIYFEKAEIKIKKGEQGDSVNEEELVELITETLKNKVENSNINVPIKKIDGNTITQEDLEKLTGVIGASTTYYNEGNVDRSTNIRISTGKLNNIVLKPNETISMNALTKDDGYRPALVIVGEQIVNGIGGGICQTATTLFQAAVRAGMTIVESNNHTIAPEYTGLATDAMISGWSDLKFRNDFDFPVIIKGRAGGGAVSFEILGDTSKKNYTVDVVPGKDFYVAMPIEEVEDPSLAQGEKVITQKGWPGHRIETYIKDEKKGTYKLRDNYYPPKKQIVSVGVKTDYEFDSSIYDNINIDNYNYSIIENNSSEILDN